MRAALGLPVPQIKREQKRLEDSDLTVYPHSIFDSVDIIRAK